MRTFYTIVLTQTLSLLGSQISGLAVGIHLYNTTGNATPLALVAFFGMLPQVIIASFAGIAADRYDRRYVMALSDFGQAVMTFLLLINFVSGGFQVEFLYIAVLIRQIFGAFQYPAFTATISLIVPDEQRDRANAISQLNAPLAGIIAPVIAGIVYAASGVTGAIAIDLLTALVAVVIILRQDIPSPKRTEAGAQLRGSALKELLAGFRYLWQRRILFWLTLYATALNFLLNGVGTLMTPYLLARTDNDAVFGVLSGLTNAGMIVGAVLMGVIGGTKRNRMHLIFPGIVTTGVVLALWGTAQSIPALAIFGFVMFVPMPMVNAAFMSIMQAKVAPDVQGRVFATVGQLAMLFSPLSMLLVGPLTDNIFEPAVHTAGWQTFAPIFGSEAGAGMGLLFAIVGSATAILSLVVYAFPAARHAETRLPDYEQVGVETEAKPGAEAVPA